jgi:hypothetical protein
MSTIHFVYPFDPNKKFAPFTIGNNLTKYFKNFYDVKNYNWTSTKIIYPKKNDILIGHPHFASHTIFNRSCKINGWKKKIILQPFNFSLDQCGHLLNIIDEVDLFLAISGKYWFDNLKKSIFRHWSYKIKRIDMAVNCSDFKFLKKKVNKKGKRKFLYIGVNSKAKNLNYLYKISLIHGKEKFSTIGAKIKNINCYGWRSLLEKKTRKIIKKYDYLINTSSFDANPTTILEAMSLGIIPVVTNQSGYYKNKGIFNIKLDDLKNVNKLLNYLQNISQNQYKKIQLYNSKQVKNFNFRRFCRTIFQTIEMRNIIKKKINLESKENRIIYTQKLRSLAYNFRPKLIIKHLLKI